MAFLGKQEAELDLEVVPSSPVNGTEGCGSPTRGRVGGIYRWQQQC